MGIWRGRLGYQSAWLRDMQEVLVMPGQGWRRRYRKHFLQLVQKVTGHEMQVALFEVGEDELLKDVSGKRRAVIQLSQSTSKLYRTDEKRDG